jgi:hypothetical protein
LTEEEEEPVTIEGLLKLGMVHVRLIPPHIQSYLLRSNTEALQRTTGDAELWYQREGSTIIVLF